VTPTDEFGVPKRTAADVDMLAAAAVRVEADTSLPEPLRVALASLFRRQAWLGGLGLEWLYRIPGDEIIDAAQAVLALGVEVDHG
jgi:hypothetical protein